MSEKRRATSPRAASVEDAVLNDPRWEALAAGEATPNEIAELQALSERSAAAKVAWDALQPVTEAQLDELTTRALREVEARKLSRAHGTEILAGKYRLLKELWRSPATVDHVWEAENIFSGRLVVVKRAARHEVLKYEFVDLLKYEAQILRHIRHPHILKLLDSGENPDGSYYMVTERLEGQDLRQFLKEKGRLEVAQALQIAREAASALDAMHTAGFAHLDVCPSNIFLHRRGPNDFVAKLIDAKSCKELHSLRPRDIEANLIPHNSGGIAYSSPEILKSKTNADKRDDIWSLGILLYEMLTGEKPFRASTVLELVSQVITKSVPPPSHLRADVPASLDELVRRCTTRDPVERYQVVGEVIAMLTSIEFQYRENRAISDRSRAQALPAETSPLYLGGLGSVQYLPPHPYRPHPPPPQYYGIGPVEGSITHTFPAVAERFTQEAQEPPTNAMTPDKAGFLRRNWVVAVVIVAVLGLAIPVTAPSQWHTYALFIESVLLIGMATIAVRFYRHARKTESSSIEIQGKLQTALDRIQSLDADNKRHLGWLDALTDELDGHKNELAKRPMVERKIYRILTVGMKATGKSLLTLKWANPLVDLGTIEGTTIERYERTLSQVRTRDTLVEHVFEVHDWGGEHIVDAQQALITEKIHGILMVVDLGGKDAHQIDQGRIAEQLDEFNPKALHFLFGPQPIASCKTIVLFINKSDLITSTPDEAEVQAKALYAPLIDSLMQYAPQVDVKVFVGSARNGHSLHRLFGHLVEQILPKSAYDELLLQRIKGIEHRRVVPDLEAELTRDENGDRASMPLMPRVKSPPDREGRE